MTELSLHTTQLHSWLDRMRAGDAAAREELFRRVGTRLEKLAHKMLRRFPGVARWEQTGDVLNQALPRLLHALESLRPDSVGEFFGLAAEHLRRALLDLARHYRRERDAGNHSGAHDPGQAETTPDPAADLDRWTAFHEAAAGLPQRERAVFSLRFYHGLSGDEIAGVLDVDARTARRHWHSACVQLREALHGEFPQP
jgi:RNA polymerase sigma-70 factor (ECF subfamily)